MTSRVRLALLWTGLILLSQAFPLPSSVQNAATDAWEMGYRFDFPLAYILSAPFSMVADACTLLGAQGSFALLGWLVVFSLLVLGIKRGIIFILLFTGFAAWGALAPRPMARLVAENPDVLLIDFHSHSQRSHDGRPSFTPEANRSWHRAQGYGASFITDHNRIEASQASKEASRQDWQKTGYSSLEGEEVSLEKTHLAVLGVHERIDNKPYDSDPAKIPVFIKDMHKKGLLVIASLPEYWLYHWGTGVQDLIDWGIDGFEIVNSAPKALDFPPIKKMKIIDLVSKNNLFVTGISDTHGYGSATACWNAMFLPGWQNLDPDQLEKRVMKALKNDRFKAVTVLERPRYHPTTRIQAAFAPWVSLGLLWRSLTPLLALGWIAWIWIGVLLYSAVARGTQRSGPKR